MKLSKLSIPYRAVNSAVKLAAVALFTSTGGLQQLNFLGGALVFFAVLGLSAVYSYLYWRNFEFSFSEDSVNIRHGVIRRNEREIPLSRVQNVDVNRNLIHRILGIAVVKLETAGGKTTEASFKYINLEQSEDIKKIIREKKSKASEEDEEEDDERELLYSIDKSELLLLGATSIDERVVFLLLGLTGFSATSFAPVLDEANVALVPGLSLVLFLGLIIVFATNFVSTVTRYYDYRLWREKDTLEYERGLFNRSEGSIPLGKLQKLVIEDNPLKRVIDRASLSIETAGYSQQTTSEKGPELAIPLSTRKRIIEFSEEIDNVEKFELEKIPERGLKRYFTRYMILSGIICLGLYFGAGYFSYILPVVLLIASGLAASLKWVHKGYAETENHFVARNGFWKRETVIVPYYRTQNVITTSTVSQRLWDLSTVTVDIAGSSLIGGDARAVDLDVKQARKLAGRLHSKFQNSL
ncbi:PH domain-containing protein [Candidatus Nanosalina sp. VS9-1]|uniref:PH domain-containing protein n=1 Tax=Candidatus Nanosalina sp. VS9-1 TaxID=3388566 RepID=UPI0039DFA700